MDDKLPYDPPKPKQIVVHQSPKGSVSGKDVNESEENAITMEFDENEDEIQVIDLESAVPEKSPLFLLFPDLEQEFSDERDLLSRIQSTTEMTRLLQGKRANFQLLKPCQKLKIEV